MTADLQDKIMLSGAGLTDRRYIYKGAGLCELDRYNDRTMCN